MQGKSVSKNGIHPSMQFETSIADSSPKEDLNLQVDAEGNFVHELDLGQQTQKNSQAFFAAKRG